MMMLIKNLVMQNKLLLILMSMFKNLQARQALIAKTNEKQSAINSDNEGTIEEKQSNSKFE